MNLRNLVCLSCVSLMLGGLSGRAQVCNPARPMGPWQGSIESLAAGESKASMATINYSETAAATATPAQRFAHGSDCLIAASRALELNNPARARVLLGEAKLSLTLARTQLDQRAVALRARSAYMLGQIAEKHELDLNSAAAYYAESAQLSPRNTDAAEALARVRRNLAFRQTLRG